jgi:D-aminopeptidase
MIPNHHMSPLFSAAAEAVEEAILNALVAAETMTGYKGRTAYALPHDELRRVMAKYR